MPFLRSLRSVARRGTDLRDESVSSAGAGALQGIRGGKVRRAREPGDVGGTQGMHRDPAPFVKAAAAKVGRVSQCRAIVIELRHEGIEPAATVDGLDRVCDQSSTTGRQLCDRDRGQGQHPLLP